MPNLPLTVLAVDPGTTKCGVAVVGAGDEPQVPVRVLHREVVETERLIARVLVLLAIHPAVSTVLVGNATRGAVLQRAIQEAVSAPVTVVSVEEAFTSQRARTRFQIENPPRGLRRLIPPGMRTPPRPYDDYVAVLLAEDYLVGFDKETRKK